jgi:hypothetical protein
MSLLLPWNHHKSPPVAHILHLLKPLKPCEIIDISVS